jgi:restriction system protein
MARHRNNDLWDELADSPWWISVVFAVVVYVGISWVLPSIAGSNIFLRAIAKGMQGVAWIFALPFLLVAGFAAFRSYSRRHLLDSQKGLETLRALSWQNFERLVGEAYRRQGYVVEEVGGSAPDGGIDLVLHRQGSKVIVQCKRWKSAQVGVSSIREFYGVTVAKNAERGIFVTTGTFTRDALDFADGKPLELVDGRHLAILVEGVQPAKPATEAPPTPACPKCGGEMVQRLAKRGANAGREFWGCRRYPECSGIRSLV